MGELQEFAARYMEFKDSDLNPSGESEYERLVLRIAEKLTSNVPDDYRLGQQAKPGVPAAPPDPNAPPQPAPPPTPADPTLPPQPPEGVPKNPPIAGPDTLPKPPSIQQPGVGEDADPSNEAPEPEEGIWAYDSSGSKTTKLQPPKPPANDAEFQRNVLGILPVFSRSLHTSLSRGGNLTGIKAASEQDIAEKQQFSDVKEISINLPSGKDVKLYLDPLGSGAQQKSNAMIYYQPGLNELEVAEAIGSLQFAQAWQDHQTATGGGYNVESGFDVVAKFKADQKQAFGEAAPIIHDLVMDVVRTTGGGEIAYAIYVSSEKGFFGYLGSRAKESYKDAKVVANLVKNHPTESAGIAAIFVVVKGRGIFRAKRRRVGGELRPKLGNMPNRAKWIRSGGRVISHADGTTTYMRGAISVVYNAEGYPNFRPYMYNGKNGSSQVKIELTGSRQSDEVLANQAAGFVDTPPGYTWHHHEDVGVMQLVIDHIHSDFWHSGGFSIGKTLHANR